MDYTQYVNRRPPSPPSPHHRYKPFAPSASLSSAASTVSSDLALNSPSRPPFHTAEAVSSQLHRRAVRDEYAALAAVVLTNTHLDDQRERHELIRIRLEDMLTTAEPANHRVLQIALSKCSARLDHIANQSHHLEQARSRMRVIEAKHFHGANATAIAPRLRAMHIRREQIATLVDHIRCTLHDQVRIHYLLTTLSEKLSVLLTLVGNVDRNQRPIVSDMSDRPALYKPSRTMSPRGTSFTHDSSRRHTSSRRIARNLFIQSKPDHATTSHTMDSRVDRAPNRTDRGPSSSNRRSNNGYSLPTQRSLPQRADSRHIPFVVKRALSYNASPTTLGHSTSTEPLWQNRSSSVHERTAGQSEPRLKIGDSLKRIRKMPGSSRSSGSFAADRESHRRQRILRVGTDPDDSEHSLSGSPVSPNVRTRRPADRVSSSEKRSHQRRDSQLEQSVLMDIDSLCTEASSVLSSSRGTNQELSEKRSSASVFGGEHKRGLGLTKFGFHRVRLWSQIRKLWAEVNELYGIVLTHGPHLVEEKIVSPTSIEHGVLGTWISPRKGRASGMKGRVHRTITAEAVRKVDDIVIWQQKLIVAIRRDGLEQKKMLRQADMTISEAYLTSLQTGPGPTAK